jgi:hypothetical protein
MAKSKTTNGKRRRTEKQSSAMGGLKGFGPSSSSNLPAGVGGEVGGGGIVDRSPPALKFYDYLVRNGGGANLSRVGLGRFPMMRAVGPDVDVDDDDDDDVDVVALRGVVALRDINRGETIIEVPYEMSMNLGRENADPTLPATTFLQKYCSWKCGGTTSSKIPPGDRDRGDYFAMVPRYAEAKADCLGSTDFYSNVALDMLQCPYVKDETVARRTLVDARYERDVLPMARMSSNLYRWEVGGDGDDEGDGGGGDGDGTIASVEHLRWATWVVTSRVLTVQGDGGASAPAYRLLIPLIDMCNHDRDSPHVLTGRAVPGASLKVVAGKDLRAGDPVNIAYGGGVEGNDRFVQDYGFLDTGGSKERGVVLPGMYGDNDDAIVVAEGYRIVARMILGRGGGRSATSRRMSASDSQRTLEALGATTLEEDEILMKSGTVVANDERMALEYRMGVKRALRLLQ